MTHDTAKQSQLKDLERRLAEAKGPSLEIDAFIWESVDQMVTGPIDIPEYTASLDAAVSLTERVLPHWGIKLDLWRDRDNEWNWWVKLTSPTEPDYEGDDPETFIAGKPHPHAALALCLACVRTLIAQGEK